MHIWARRCLSARETFPPLERDACHCPREPHNWGPYGSRCRPIMQLVPNEAWKGQPPIFLSRTSTSVVPSHRRARHPLFVVAECPHRPCRFPVIYAQKQYSSFMKHCLAGAARESELGVHELLMSCEIICPAFSLPSFFSPLCIALAVYRALTYCTLPATLVFGASERG